ncbi:MAG: LacI family DNA-binding transcriptional regulator [Mycobacterium sp.]
MVNSKDVAALAGLSQSTVSRVFRDAELVAPETVERVRAAARQLGYLPSESARALLAGQSFQVALVVEKLVNSTFATLADRLHEELITRGYRLVIVESDSERGGLTEAMKRSLAGVDGVIHAASDWAGSSAVIDFADAGRPVVFAIRRPALDGIDTVQIDDAAGCELAVDHLWGLGHRDIAMIGADARLRSGADRASGFRKSMADRGIKNPVVIDCEMSYEGGFDHARELLSRRRRPTAVFASDDAVGCGVIDGARDLGLDVPADIAVVGFDDSPISAWRSFDLTTLRVPQDQLANRAVRLLIDRIEQGAGRVPTVDGPRHETVAVSLIVRGSTAPPAS